MGHGGDLEILVEVDKHEGEHQQVAVSSYEEDQGGGHQNEGKSQEDLIEHVSFKLDTLGIEKGSENHLSGANSGDVGLVVEESEGNEASSDEKSSEEIAHFFLFLNYKMGRSHQLAYIIPLFTT